ncbi:TauD/TfdA family dioxygenase [Nocardia vinacea]|uniref:TauD/TfdA family dioxygenase n=1 Tax=Nocardia vinacea TaxID=96468 RepID=UPI000A00DB26
MYGDQLRDLESNGFCVLSGINVADDDELISAASLFGTPSAIGNGNPSRLISEIAIQSASESSLHSENWVKFDLHTDSTGYPRPHSVIVMGCLKAARDGGESILLLVDSIISSLPADTRRLLQVPLFEFVPAVGWSGHRLITTVLSERGEHWRIRWRRDVMSALSRRAEDALLAMGAAIDATSPKRIKLQTNDVLIVDNRRCLHGRAAFGESSDRHLRRIKMSSLSRADMLGSPPSLWLG